MLTCFTCDKVEVAAEKILTANDRTKSLIEGLQIPIRITSFPTNRGDPERMDRVRDWNYSSLHLLEVDRGERQASDTYISTLRKNIRYKVLFVHSDRRVRYGNIGNSLARTLQALLRVSLTCLFKHRQRGGLAERLRTSLKLSRLGLETH